MGGGFALMNELTVIQATQGFIRFIQKYFANRKEKLSVVIGFDGRHQSKNFARLAASLFIHEQIHVYLFDRQTVPTPFIPFTIRQYQCQAGIMITASHNPKDDNGYKVYWHNGAQIVSPIDCEIAQLIEENLEPWPGKAWNSKPLENFTCPFLTDPIDDVRSMKHLNRLVVQHCFFSFRLSIVI
jgi:phosphomannomutase